MRASAVLFRQGYQYSRGLFSYYHFWIAALLRKPRVLMPGLGSLTVLLPATDALGCSEYDSMHSFRIIGTN